jgi:hypothetical protein
MVAPRADMTIRKAAAASGYLPAWHTQSAFNIIGQFAAIGVRMAAGVSGDPEICLGPGFLSDGRYVLCSMTLHDEGWSYHFDFEDYGLPPLSCDATWEIPDELRRCLVGLNATP